MTATPLWFGPDDRPLFGWLHAPDDGVIRGGVVLCPPVGYEEICAHRTFRELAERLAASGFVALRFDYDGVGDSAGGHEDPDRMAAWHASIDAAIALLREAGAPSVAAIGMRLGATLVASHDVAALVLWDPVWSGRTFVRQLRALTLLGTDDGGLRVDAHDDGSMAVAGTVYSSETLAQLRALHLPDLTSTTAPILALVRDDRPASDDERALLPAHAVLAEATAQSELLDGPSIRSKVPRVALDRIIDWLTSTFSTQPGSLNQLDCAEIGPMGERFVRLGPVGLFGIVTEVDPDPDKPVVVLLNNSIDHHVGPNRLWVDLARRLAPLGFPVARVDISGIGDSPARPGQAIDRVYPVEAIDDVVAIAAALDRGAGVVLGGLCSGARNGIDAAVIAPVRGVVAINPPLHAPRDVIEQLSTENPDPAALVTLNELRPIVHRAQARIPAFVWRALHRARLVHSHADGLDAIERRGTDTLVVYGEDDFFGRIVKRTAAWHMADLARRPGFRHVTVADLDHGLMRWAGREEVADHVVDHLVQRYGVRATTWNQSTSDTSSPSPTLRPSSRA